MENYEEKQKRKNIDRTMKLLSSVRKENVKKSIESREEKRDYRFVSEITHKP